MNAFKLLAAAPHRTRESRLVRWKDSRVKTGGPDGHHIPPSASPSPRPNRTTSSASAGFDLWVMRGRSSCFLASVRVRASVRPSGVRLSSQTANAMSNSRQTGRQTDDRGAVEWTIQVSEMRICVNFPLDLHCGREWTDRDRSGGGVTENINMGMMRMRTRRRI